MDEFSIKCNHCIMSNNRGHCSSQTNDCCYYVESKLEKNKCLYYLQEFCCNALAIDKALEGKENEDNIDVF